MLNWKTHCPPPLLVHPREDQVFQIASCALPQKVKGSILHIVLHMFKRLLKVSGQTVKME